MKGNGASGMFEPSAEWNEYYRELEPRRRRALLEALCASGPDDGANAYRRLLLEARHGNAKSPGREVDRMLFMCVDFLRLCQSSRLFRGGAAREVRRYLRELRFDQAGQYGEAGTRALYWECRNAVARYLSTCDSPDYDRGWFGLIPSREADRQARVARDVWELSVGIARRTGLTGELRLWSRAARDAYCLSGADAKARFDACDEKMSKR